MQSVDIYLEFEAERYQLPVLPAQIQLQMSSGNESAETIALGEVTVLKTRKLRTLTIESFFPAHPSFPFCRTAENFKKPVEYIRAIERAQTELIPARLTLAGTGISAFWVSIEDFRFAQAQDENIAYSLSLKEYRPYGQRAKTMEQSPELFDEHAEEPSLIESFGQMREPTDFAVGDRVVVFGRFYASPDGAAPPLQAPSNYLMQHFSVATLARWKGKDILKSSDLNGQRCIIVDRDMGRIRYHDLPSLGDTPVAVPAPYCYCVADLHSRKSIGWVAAAQMRRLS